MPKKMTDLHMKEISGVDRAANLSEGWLMMKSASPQARSLLSDALYAANGIDPTARRTEHMPFDKAAIEANPEAALAHIEALEKALATVAPAPVAAPEPTEADVLAKSLESLPEPLRKAVVKAQRDAAEAQEEVRKERARRETEHYATVAKSLDSLPDVTEALGETIVKARGGDVEAVESLVELLRKANAVVKSSAAFSEIGSSAPAPDSAEGQLQALTKALKANDPSLTDAAALEKACEQNPHLYAEYRADVNKKNRS